MWARAHGCRVARDRGKTQPSFPSLPFCEAQVSCGNLLHLGRSLLARGDSRPQGLPRVPGVESGADHQVAACLCAQAPDGMSTCSSEVPNCKIFISVIIIDFACVRRPSPNPKQYGIWRVSRLVNTSAGRVVHPERAQKLHTPPRTLRPIHLLQLGVHLYPLSYPFVINW